MTPKHFSDRIRSYDLPKTKINYTKNEKKKRIVRSPFSPGMQEHVARRMGNVRNTCIKNIQIVYCVTKSVVNPSRHPIVNTVSVSRPIKAAHS
jgi:hypothetical protein